MKLNVLKEALGYYVQSADCSTADRSEAIKAYNECLRQEERYDDCKLWKDHVHVITTNSLLALLNTATYDIYGKLARIHGDEVPFGYYTDAVRKTLDIDLTNDALRTGFDFLHDLWRDNDAAGYNNEDGTFNYNK